MFCTNRQQYLNSEQISPPRHKFMYRNRITDPHILYPLDAGYKSDSLSSHFTPKKEPSMNRKGVFLACLHALKTCTFVFLRKAVWSQSLLAAVESKKSL